jgi:hypothetical protein
MLGMVPFGGPAVPDAVLFTLERRGIDTIHSFAMDQGLISDTVIHKQGIE